MGKKYPVHQIATKKILDDQKSTTTPPPQELNGQPLIVAVMYMCGHEPSYLHLRVSI